MENKIISNLSYKKQNLAVEFLQTYYSAKGLLYTYYIIIVLSRHVETIVKLERR